MTLRCFPQCFLIAQITSKPDGAFNCWNNHNDAHMLICMFKCWVSVCQKSRQLFCLRAQQRIVFIWHHQTVCAMMTELWCGFHQHSTCPGENVFGSRPQASCGWLCSSCLLNFFLLIFTDQPYIHKFSTFLVLINVSVVKETRILWHVTNTVCDLSPTCMSAS